MAYELHEAAVRQFIAHLGIVDVSDADAGKKRDEIAGRMQPGDLAAAKATAAAWKAKPLDPRANEVTAPEGGWDVPVKTGAAKQKGNKA